MESKHATIKAVMAEELGEIQRRRIAKGVTQQSKSEVSDGKPLNDLVGLALSGGGIRSATFGLGVLECLKQHNLLRRVDYLSSVSGGGYIGGWLSANCIRAQEQGGTTKPWVDKDSDWKTSIVHLRRYSNYLSPKLGFFSADTWAMFTVWSRNMLLVLTTVVLAIAGLLVIPRFLGLLFDFWHSAGDLRWLSVALFLVAVSGIAGNLMRMNQSGIVPFTLQVGSWPRSFAYAAVLLAGACIFSYASSFQPFNSKPTDWFSALVVASLLVAASFFLLPVALRLVRAFFLLFLKSTSPPAQIDYGQGWVQVAIVLPLLAAAFLFSAVLWGQQYGGQTGGRTGLSELATYSALLKCGWSIWPFPLSIAFVSLGLLACAGMYRSQSTWESGWRFVLFPLAVLLPMMVLHALLCAIVMLIRAFGDSQGLWPALIFGPALILFSFSLSIVVQIGMLGRQSSEGFREWWSRLGAWVSIYGIAWILICSAAIYGPHGFSEVVEHSQQLASWLTAWGGATLAGLLAGKSGATVGKPQAGTAKPGWLPIGLEGVAVIAPFVFIVGLFILIATGLHRVITHVAVPFHATDCIDYWCTLLPRDVQASELASNLSLVLGVVVVLVLALSMRVDINEFGLNAFYRSRLARCYLGASRVREGERKPQSFTGFDENDDFPLSRLSALSGPSGPEVACAPYPIVNCALNLGGSSDLALHTRHGASFFFTPLVAGSPYELKQEDGRKLEIGFLPVSDYGGARGAPTLAQVVSVSGAAASPNMGYHTSPVVAFLLTVFNVRLGWWFPSPIKGTAAHPSPWFSLRYLIKELFGGADEHSNFLMISDGGHFENLGAYELVRRQCRVIVISDAECDPEFGFGGLGTFIRLCEVDFGVSIDIDVKCICPDKDSTLSGCSHAIGTIRYNEGEVGTLIYLKASMPETHDKTDLCQYRASHPEFPHESTGDQFYGEDQFESYRRLGMLIAERALCFRPPESMACFTSVKELIEDGGVPVDSAH